MRVYGSIGALPKECINPPKNRWVARWDFRNEENGGISYEEEVFDHEPSDDEIESAASKRLSDIRAELAKKITDHDTSAAVNGFNVAIPGSDPIVMWLNREQRSGLRVRFDLEQRANKPATTLWGGGGLSITLTPGNGLQMLDALELYAAASYDQTQQHLIAASGLASRSECEQYDFTTGYPEKITFDIDR
jgi:hypothetical protein